MEKKYIINKDFYDRSDSMFELEENSKLLEQLEDKIKELGESL